ncbi:MAG: Ig-like domain-containing protein [Muribaculaceae bacterium]
MSALPVEAAEVTDVITNAGTINQTVSAYTSFSDKSFTSSAVYAGKISGKDGTIQINRTEANNIVTTASGGTLKKIKVVWNTTLTTANALEVYASNTAYEAVTTTKQGTLLGQIAFSAAVESDGEKYTEFTFPADVAYSYFALFGAGGVTYSDRIEVTWEETVTSLLPVFSPAFDTTGHALTANDDGTYSLVLAPGETFSLTPTTDNAPIIIYSSTNDEVATIANGTVTAGSEGRATITGTWDEVPDTWAPGSVTIKVLVTTHPVYYLVKSVDDFDITKKCILVAFSPGSYAKVMGQQHSSSNYYRDALDIDIEGSVVPTELDVAVDASEFTLEEMPASSPTTYHMNLGDAYVSLDDSSPHLKQVEKDSATALDLSFDSNSRVSLAVYGKDRALGYNNSASPTRFASYTKEDLYIQVYLYQKRYEAETPTVIVDWDGIDTGAEVSCELVSEFEFPSLTVTPDEAASLVRYSSSDESVATIDPITGEITRLAVGSTTITAAINGDDTFPDASDSYILTINDSRKEVRLEFSKSEMSLFLRDADEFSWPECIAYVDDEPDDNALQAVVFSTNNDEVLRIGSDYSDHNFIGCGEADIIAEIPADCPFYKPTGQVKCHITVTKVDVSMSFSSQSVDAGLFGEFSLPVLTVDPDETSIKDEISYNSSNPDVAEVDETTGEVTLYQAGTAVITASFAGDALFSSASASYTLNVSDNRPTPVISWSCGSEMTFAIGGDATFESPTVMVQEADDINTDDVMDLLTFASSDESVATVDDYGLVSVISEGTAVITAAIPAGDANYAQASASFTLVVTSGPLAEYHLTYAGETFSDGDLIIIGAEDKTNFVGNEVATASDRSVFTLDVAASDVISPSAADNYMIFKVETVADGVRLLTVNFKDTDGYATGASDDKDFMIQQTPDDNLSTFTIAYIEGSDAKITNVGNSRSMRFNAGKFRFYASDLDKGIVIYKKKTRVLPSAPIFSVPDGSELNWQNCAVTVTSENATSVNYRIKTYNAESDAWEYSDLTTIDGDHAVIYVSESCGIEAYGSNAFGVSDTVEVFYTFAVPSTLLYSRISSLEQIDFTKKLIAVNPEHNVAMGVYSSVDKCHSAAEVSLSANGSQATATRALPFSLVSADETTYYMQLETGLYMLLDTDNSTAEVDNAADATKFVVSFTGESVAVLASVDGSCYLGYNAEANRFSSYTESGFASICLYQEGEPLITGIEGIDAENVDNADVEWYMLQGVRVSKPDKGFYIRRCGLKATKVFIK